MSETIFVPSEDVQYTVATQATKNLPEGEAREALHSLIFEAVAKRNAANRELRLLKTIVAVLE